MLQTLESVIFELGETEVIVTSEKSKQVSYSLCNPRNGKFFSNFAWLTIVNVISFINLIKNKDIFIQYVIK